MQQGATPSPVTPPTLASIQKDLDEIVRILRKTGLAWFATTGLRVLQNLVSVLAPAPARKSQEATRDRSRRRQTRQPLPFL
jgi:hypothetical protein